MNYQPQVNLKVKKWFATSSKNNCNERNSKIVPKKSQLILATPRTNTNIKQNVKKAKSDVWSVCQCKFHKFIMHSVQYQIGLLQGLEKTCLEQEFSSSRNS